MADKAQPKTLSQRIEETIGGFLGFLIAYLRTLAAIAFRWRRGLTEVVSQTGTEKAYVYPYTFLVIGGFLFSLIIAAYPQGLLGIVDLIWFSEEISANIINNFRQAFSITSLLIGGFPTFVAVVLLSYLASRIEEKDADRRRKLASAYQYVFGYQAAVLFGWLAVVLLLPATGIDPCKRAPLLCQDGPVKDIAAVALLLSFPFFFILAPLASFAAWRWRRLEKARGWRPARLAASLTLFLGIMVVYAGLASAPSQVLNRINPPPEPALAVTSASLTPNGEGPSALTIIATLTNPTTSPITLQSNDLAGEVSIEGVAYAKWTLEDLTLTARDQFHPSLLTVPPGQTAVVRIDATLDLPDPASARLRQAIESRTETVPVELRFTGSGIVATGYVGEVVAGD